MIEEEMVFALGFLTAGLLGFLCLPAVWRRALRLTTRRLKQLVPLSADEIVAERDQLRAGFAVEQRRLEQKLERSEASRAEALAEGGRRTARIAVLDAGIARLSVEVAALQAEHDSVSRTLAAQQGENGAFATALLDATERMERQSAEILDLEERNRVLGNQENEHRAAIAALETMKIGLETRQGDLVRSAAADRAEHDRLKDALRRVEGERDAAREAAQTMAGKRDGLAGQIEEQDARIASLTTELAREVERSAERDAQLQREMNAAEAARAALDELRRIQDQAEGKHAAELEATRGEERRRAVQIEELRAEKTALANALAAARAERGPLPPTAPPIAPSGGAHELAALREAIRKVADDVLRASARPDGHGPASSPNTPDRARAEP